MGIFDLQKRPAREIFPGVRIRTVWGERIMMSFVEFDPEGEVPLHHHPHEQMGMGLEGEFELIINGEAYRITPGTPYWIPSGVPHRAKPVGGPAKALDIFSPPREDYLF